jgi:hypothetical protein
MVYNCTRAPHVSYLILEEPNWCMFIPS